MQTVLRSVRVDSRRCCHHRPEHVTPSALRKKQNQDLHNKVDMNMSMALHMQLNFDAISALLSQGRFHPAITGSEARI